MKQVVWYQFFINVAASLVIAGGVAFGHPVEGHRKIVVFQRDISGQNRQEVAKQVGGRVLHNLPLIDGIAIEFPSGRALQVVNALRQHRAVVEVYDDLVIGADHVVSMTPVEPPATELFPWGVEWIGSPAVFDLVTSLSMGKPKVAILDTGIDAKHSELKSFITGGYNARAGANPSNYQDDNGHGTNMAGIIAAAANGQGVIGVASRPALVPVKVLDSTGHGYLSDLINGLQWVAGKNIRVVNMSLSFSQDSPVLEEVTKKLYQAGVIMVAAAGNRCSFGAQDDGGEDDGGEDDGGETGCDLSLDPLQGGIKYPARYPWVIAVGATDLYDQVTSYSRVGPEVDVVAPGGTSASEKILSTNLGGGYSVGKGTSQATAHVTGAVAATLQLAPWLSVEQVIGLLQMTATDLGQPPDRQGAGLIAVDKMIKKLLGLL